MARTAQAVRTTAMAVVAMVVDCDAVSALRPPATLTTRI